ncbi:hypothetical protein [Mycoplasma suis]|uniref:Uncharacterized protein n=2 Tax=Mycoplasma suis TaxID=57372 RepID=F0QQV4_MYCSL|nr:hypothetical protein [Mycoplasma suis]ADX97874.1 hypothetical protein MSU_0332 [Mycoplasma suis str. Illinois]
MLGSKFLIPLFVSAGTIAGGGVTFLIPEAKASGYSNTLTLFKENSSGSLEIGESTSAQAEGKSGGQITLKIDSWNFSNDGKNNSSFSLKGEKWGHQEDTSDPKWTPMIQNIQSEDERKNERIPYLSSLGGEVTFYVSGLDCKGINKNFSIEKDEQLKKVFDYRNEEKLKNNQESIKLLANGEGLAILSCHQN